MKRILILLTIVFTVMAAQLSLAGVKIVQEAVTTMNGKEQEQSSGEMTAYYTEDKLRMEDAQGKITIMRLDTGTMWSLDPESKTYTEQTVEQMTEQMKGMPESMMNIEMEVEKTDETETINDYKCKKIIVKMKIMGMTVTMEIWATTDIKPDPVLLKFSEKANKVFESIPMLKSTFGAFKEVFDENSFPIKTVTKSNMFGMNTENVSTVTSVSTEDFDDALFDIPEDYKKKAMRGFGGGMK